MSIFIKSGLWIEKNIGYPKEFNLTKYIKDLIAATPIIGSFIPLSGTTVGNPVTGDIEFIEDGFKRLYSKGNSGDNLSEITFEDTQISFRHKTIDNTFNSFLSINGKDLTYDSIDPTSKGIRGSQNFSLNITDLDYTQKIYTDGLLPQVADNFLDDTTAAVGGIAVGRLYHTGGVVKIRLT